MRFRFLSENGYKARLRRPILTISISLHFLSRRTFSWTLSKSLIGILLGDCSRLWLYIRFSMTYHTVTYVTLWKLLAHILLLSSDFWYGLQSAGHLRVVVISQLSHDICTRSWQWSCNTRANGDVLLSLLALIFPLSATWRQS